MTTSVKARRRPRGKARSAEPPSLTVETLTSLVERATLAPSARNAQPWQWTIHADRAVLELAVDPARAMPVGDPVRRELVMSCGAALFTLRVAAAEALLRAEVEVLPDPAQPDLLARVRLLDGAVDAAFSGLDASVPLRHTFWRRFADRAVPAELLERLTTEVAAEGVRLYPVPPEHRAELGWLARQADLARFENPALRAELASSLRPKWSRSGLSRPIVTLVPRRIAVRQLNLGRRVAAADESRVSTAPLLVVLCTEGEDRASWLAAGQALQRALLVATSFGVLSGFVNSPCQDPDARVALRRLLGLPGHPQAVVRFGYPREAAPPARRRPVRDVVTVEGGDGGGEGPSTPAARSDWFDDALG
jgi:nitroreductase